ncbi:hypothetical protein Patl1_20579 [Pistacia atlantica]|uniref:Uncharacterized protein n=1 Tax=Pistacia atlantica TaxID=434234 RepID=A0ACC1BMB9_9ROSI|nr:hypothetical protein Patl1_20579 [Pistacia atlantica]
MEKISSSKAVMMVLVLAVAAATVSAQSNGMAPAPSPSMDTGAAFSLPVSGAIVGPSLVLSVFPLFRH